MALVNLSSEQVNVEELSRAGIQSNRIFQAIMHSENIALRYAMILVNLSMEQINVEERGNTANLIQQIFERLSSLEDIALRYTLWLLVQFVQLNK